MVLKHFHPLSEEITEIRKQIIQEILLTDQNKHMLDWFGPSWEQQNYIQADVVYDSEGVVLLCASEFTHDSERIKVGCRTYQMYDTRPKHHSVNQRIVFPEYANIAKQLGVRYLWYTYHAFDRRHERYVQSHIRGISHTSNNEMPLYREFKYDGIVEYKDVNQHSFVCDLFKKYLQDSDFSN